MTRVYIKYWIGSDRRSPIYACSLSASAEASHGLSAPVAHLRQIIVTNVMHPLLAIRKLFPFVPLNEFYRTMIANAQHAVRSDGKKVCRRGTACSDGEILILPRVNHAIRQFCSKVSLAFYSRKHIFGDIGRRTHLFSRQYQLRMRKSASPRKKTV